MSFLDLIKLLLPLFIICGLLFGVLYFVKKYSFKKNGSSQLNIKVISSQLLMPKKFISVVRINDKLLVLGVSENNITLLKEFEAEAELQLEEPKMNTLSAFTEMFKKNLTGK